MTTQQELCNLITIQAVQRKLKATRIGVAGFLTNKIFINEVLFLSASKGYSVNAIVEHNIKLHGLKRALIS